ncbi:MAG: HEAT repeat domain-containing protein [Pirellulaceae bacterium]
MKSIFQKTRSRVGMAVICTVLLSGSAFGQRDLIYDDWPMFEQPALPQINQVKFQSEKLVPLWIDSLQSDNRELARLAAHSVAVAASRGLTGLELTIPHLVNLVTSQEQPTTTRKTALTALVRLEASESGPQLLELLPSCSIGMRQIIEPTLAQWQTDGARKYWLEVLSDSKSSAAKRLAIRCLSKVATADDVELLRGYVLDKRVGASNRIAAAKGLANAADTSFTDLAASLVGDGNPDPLTGLVASWLIQNPPAEGKLAQQAAIAQALIAQDGPASILAAQAWLSWDTENALAAGEALRRHAESDVRLAYAEKLAGVPDDASVNELVDMLDDVDPRNRKQVRIWLEAACDNEALAPIIRERVVSVLASVTKENWWIGEQAIYLAVKLDEKSVTPNLVKLLPGSRPELFVTAAWALRVLDDREQLPQVLAYCTMWAPHFPKEELPRDIEHEINEQMAHLFQWFGLVKYAEATQVLELFVKKNGNVRFRIRAAATWAMAQILEGDSENERWIKLLLERLNDDAPMPPESPLVKRMAVVALAKMGVDDDKIERNIRDLQVSTPEYSVLKDGCNWALNKLYGDPIPPMPDQLVDSGPWLLEPLEDRTRGR